MLARVRLAPLSLRRAAPGASGGARGAPRPHSLTWRHSRSPLARAPPLSRLSLTAAGAARRGTARLRPQDGSNPFAAPGAAAAPAAAPAASPADVMRLWFGVADADRDGKVAAQEALAFFQVRGTHARTRARREHATLLLRALLPHQMCDRAGKGEGRRGAGLEWRWRSGVRRHQQHCTRAVASGCTWCARSKGVQQQPRRRPRRRADARAPSRAHAARFARSGRAFRER